MTSFDPLYVGRVKFEFEHSDHSINFKSKFELRIQFELQYLNSEVIIKEKTWTLLIISTYYIVITIQK
jgi:hypothetical protein